MTLSIAERAPCPDPAYVQMCECGQGPRVGGKATGCKRCERIERQRLDAENPTERVLFALRLQDTARTAVDLAETAGLEVKCASDALRRLTDSGRVEMSGSAGGARYQIRRAV